MNCEYFRNMISSEVDSLLSEEEIKKLDEHCTECISCQNERFTAKRLYSICKNSPNLYLDDEFKEKISISPQKKQKKYMLKYTVSAAAIMAVIIVSATLKTADLKENYIKLALNDTVDQSKNEAFEKAENEETELSQEAAPVIETEKFDYFPQQEPQAEEVIKEKTEVETFLYSADNTTESTNTENVSENDKETEEEQVISVGGGGSSPSGAIPAFEDIKLVSDISDAEKICNVLQSINIISQGTYYTEDFSLTISLEEFDKVVSEFNENQIQFVISNQPNLDNVNINFIFQ